MESGKIQLASYSDLQFVRTNVLDALRASVAALTGSSKIDAATEAELAKEANEILALLQHNVQINGFDYDPTQDPATAERLEPVKEALVREVEALKASTDDLMVQVTAKRRTVPTAWAQAWSAQAAAAIGTPEHPSVAVLPTSTSVDDMATDAALDLSEAARALDGGLTLLEQLQVTVPALADKMRRFNEVMAEVPRLQASHTTRLLSQVGAAGGTAQPAAAAADPASDGAAALAARGLASLNRS